MDDDELLIKGLRRTLAAIGYDVRSCSDGMSVLRSKDPPDVVILDTVLPGKDGLSVLRGIGEHTLLTDTYLKALPDI